MNARPTRLTPEMVTEAARGIVDDLLKAGLIEPDQVEGSIRDIAKHGDLHEDGYKLAKALEDHEFWECDFQMAEVLDGFSWAARQEIEKAQKAWFDAEHPEPPFTVGTRVSYRNGWHNATGVIDGLYKYGPGQYTIKEDGDAGADGPQQSRIIKNWEDVALAAEPPSSP